MSEKERKTERGRERERQREGGRERERARKRETERYSERERESYGTIDVVCAVLLLYCIYLKASVASSKPSHDVSRTSLCVCALQAKLP